MTLMFKVNVVADKVSFFLSRICILSASSPWHTKMVLLFFFFSFYTPFFHLSSSLCLGIMLSSLFVSALIFDFVIPPDPKSQCWLCMRTLPVSACTPHWTVTQHARAHIHLHSSILFVCVFLLFLTSSTRDTCGPSCKRPTLRPTLVDEQIGVGPGVSVEAFHHSEMRSGSSAPSPDIHTHFMSSIHTHVSHSVAMVEEGGVGGGGRAGWAFSD